MPGNIHNSETGGAACDHCRRFREDVALMKELGLHHFLLMLRGLCHNGVVFRLRGRQI